MSVNIAINRSTVFAEVRKTTAYEGAHSGAYDNTVVKTNDETMLERYWNEAVGMLVDIVKDFLSASPSMPSDTLTISLNMPPLWDSNLTAGMQTSAVSYCENYIIAKWLEMLGIEKAGKYADAAGSQLNDVRNKIYYRKRPTRN